jgi:hypothetical protein
MYIFERSHFENVFAELHEYVTCFELRRIQIIN